MNRRDLIATLGTAGIITVAGCADNGDENTGDDTMTDNTDDDTMTDNTDDTDDEAENENDSPGRITADAADLIPDADSIDGWTITSVELTDEQSEQLRRNYTRYNGVSIDSVEPSDIEPDENNDIDATNSIFVETTVLEGIEDAEIYLENNSPRDDGHLTEQIGDEQYSMVVEEDEDDDDIVTVLCAFRFQNVIVQITSQHSRDNVPVDERFRVAAAFGTATESIIDNL